jgi:hypothetical protein
MPFVICGHIKSPEKHRLDSQKINIAKTSQARNFIKFRLQVVIDFISF